MVLTGAGARARRADRCGDRAGRSRGWSACSVGVSTSCCSRARPAPRPDGMRRPSGGRSGSWMGCPRRGSAPSRLPWGSASSAAGTGPLGLLLPSKAMTPYILGTGAVVGLVVPPCTWSARHSSGPAGSGAGRPPRCCRRPCSPRAVARRCSSRPARPPASCRSIRASTVRRSASGDDARGSRPAGPVRRARAQLWQRDGHPAAGIRARRDRHDASVDGSTILRALGWGADEARAWFWGFGRDALPLNGLVWLPEGSGPSRSP